MRRYRGLILFVTGFSMLLAGCGLRRNPLAGTIEREMAFEGNTRSFLVRMPDSEPGPDGYPVLVALHGGFGTAAGMERMSGFSPMSDEQGFIVLYPQGMDRHWNDGRQDPMSFSHREDVDDVGFIDAVLDSLSRTAPLDSSRICITGISNGGMMAYRLAAEMRWRPAAIAPVVTGLPIGLAEDGYELPTPVSVLIIQSTDDPLVPYEGGPIGRGNRGEILPTGETIDILLEQLHCEDAPESSYVPDTDSDDGCFTERFEWPSGDAGARVLMLRIVGGGHTWPGGSQYLPPGIIGNVCRDFDASRAIWDFVSECRAEE